MSEPAKRESFTEALSAGERLKIQSALLWSGDYTASIGGEDPLVSAIKNYQKRSKSKITGVLSSTERTNLLAAAQSHEDEFGWTVVVDPATGVRIGLPMKLVPLARDTPRGTRWSAKYDEVLGIGALGYRTIVGCAAGYRAIDDKAAQMAKVRFRAEDVVQRI
mgnify:CR=1 FL=1